MYSVCHFCTAQFVVSTLLNKQRKPIKQNQTKNAEFDLTVCVHVHIQYMWAYIHVLAGVKNIKQVSLGIQHILADVIAKNSETMSLIKKM